MVTAQQLIELEAKFAPQVDKGPSAFSPLERERTCAHNLGGDKMALDRNGYAEFYAWLIGKVDPDTLVELGVFRGSSLAVWDAVWPGVQILGLDLELGRYEKNLPKLLERGAFPGLLPEVRTFDAYEPDPDVITGVLGHVDVFVDDGPHTRRAITECVAKLGPLVRQAYVVEDFAGAAEILKPVFPGWEIRQQGRIAAAVRID
jgi:hypothetical protein